MNGGYEPRDLEHQRRSSGTSSRDGGDIIRDWDGPGFQDGELSVTVQAYPIPEGKAYLGLLWPPAVLTIYCSRAQIGILVNSRYVESTFMMFEELRCVIGVPSRGYCKSDDWNRHLQYAVNNHEGNK
jgi:hypothetical protein